MDEFIRLVESLTDEQWTLPGANFPARMADEDEGRPLGVIADHVAVAAPRLAERTRATAERRDPGPIDFRTLNAAHAERSGSLGRAEVVRRLREAKGEVAAIIRGFTDEQLAIARETPVGPMTVRDGIERVLIGHIQQHQGSIEGVVAPRD